MKGIYKITNIKNNKAYIGRSKDIFKRLDHHFFSLNKGKHNNKELNDDFLRYGLSNFSIEILELCNILELPEKEAYYIDHFKSVENGYNMHCRDSDFLDNKAIDKNMLDLAKNVFIKKTGATSASVKLLDASEIEYIKDIFGGTNDCPLELTRGGQEFYVIPDKYSEFKKLPFIFCYSDFRIED
jgi:group I intron endonuclease